MGISPTAGEDGTSYLNPAAKKADPQCEIIIFDWAQLNREQILVKICKVLLCSPL